MKKILTSVVLAIITLCGAYAQHPQATTLSASGTSAEKVANASEGREVIEDSEIPVAVQKAFIKSDYRGMTIVQTFALTGDALRETPCFSRKPRPDKLYELVVEDSSRSAILLFGEEGILYDIIEKV